MSMGFSHMTLGRGNTKTISITSGKGGVGKTTLVVNIAQSFAQLNKRVLILDADLGMANVDIMYGLRSKYNISHVLSGEKTAQEVIVKVADGVSLIPGGNGIYGLNRLEPMERKIFLDQVGELEGLYDYMLIDTAPGIDDNVLYFNSAAEETVVLLTPEPSSLADAYSLIKVLNQRCHETRFSVIANMVRDEQEGMQVFKRLSDVCAQFLNVGLDYKGHVPLDQKLRKANKSQQLLSQFDPRCPSSFAIQRLGKKLSGYQQLRESKGGIQFFWQQLVSVA